MYLIYMCVCLCVCMTIRTKAYTHTHTHTHTHFYVLSIQAPGIIQPYFGPNLRTVSYFNW